MNAYKHNEHIERLLTERPLDSLRFLRNILIHKVKEKQDYEHRHLNDDHSHAVPSSSTPLSTSLSFQKDECDSPKLPHFDRSKTTESLKRPRTSCPDHYDADKVLEARTTKRIRSYSDSTAIAIVDDANNESNNDNDHNINLNDLSQPIDSMNGFKKRTKNNISATISALINEYNTNEQTKEIFSPQSEHKNDYDVNEHKNGNIETQKSVSFQQIANKFQHKLKSLSSTIPSKFKLPILNKENDNAQLAGSQSYPPLQKEQERKSLQKIPLRRSRTLEIIQPSKGLSFSLSLSQRPCFGFDIGGSLTKISFFEPSKSIRWNAHDKIKAKFVTSSTKYGTSGVRDQKLSFNWKNGTFHFIHFQTHRMSEAVSLWKSEKLLTKNECFYATGGGAHKYSKYFTDNLSVRVKKGDELKCLISGLNFLLNHVSDECYYLSDPASKNAKQDKIVYNVKKDGSVFPYLLVNVGSGVSILKVDSPTQFERVSGSQIGGGTYWGLCRLCSYAIQTGNEDDALTFKKAFELAAKGNAKKVNMLVSDIYGGDYAQCNLPGDLVASAFGKCISLKDPMDGCLKMGDIARGLIDVVAMNTAQLAYLNAMRFKITRIIFAGNFLRQNDLSMAMISYAIHYWSQGVMKAMYLKHEGYFGSVGVMLLPDEELTGDEKEDDESESESDDDET